MAHTFVVKISDEAASVITKVESEITGSGGTFLGNAEKGSFSGKSVLGMIRVEYCCIAECEISITIKDKPFLVPYSAIESEIRSYFG